MKRLHNIRLSFGFLILASTPPYLVYDVHQLARGESLFPQSAFSHWFNVALAAGLILISIAWLLSLRGEDYLRFRAYWERVVALAVLIASSPVLLATALLIRLESDGPAIYTQERIGRNRRVKKRTDRRKADSTGFGQRQDRRNGDRREDDVGGEPFTIYKLRSMMIDAEKETGVAWSTGDSDPRVTNVGRFIRKTHLDELPQFYNVFLGDMSVIGPRPERPAFIAELDSQVEGYRDRLDAPPGITGLAQVNQDADETVEDVRQKLEYDKEYISKTSLLLDLKIIVKTVSLIINLVLQAFEGRSAEKLDSKPADNLVPEQISILRRP